MFPGAATRGWNTEGRIPSGAKATRPSTTGWKATGINHVSYGVPDYKRTRDFYIDLFGMRVAFEDGIKCALSFGANPEDSLYIVRRDRRSGDRSYRRLHRRLRPRGDGTDHPAALARLLADGDSAWTLTDPNGPRSRSAPRPASTPAPRSTSSIRPE